MAHGIFAIFRGLGVRHWQATLSFFGLVVAFILRLNLSVAIVGMTTSKNLKMDLKREEKALVLSSMLWGYGLLQIPSGAYGRRGYAVKLYALGNIASGIFSILIPFVALNFGYLTICVLRFMTGIAQGTIYPSVNNLMANWLIPQEKAPIMCIVQGGAIFGSLIAMYGSGYVGYHFDWPSIFYATGGVGIIWGIIHLCFGADRPETCKEISNEELVYMRESFHAENTEIEEDKRDVPWKKLFTSVPVIALATCAWCAAWSGWTLLALTPTYIDGVLGFNLEENGFVSALPYFFCCLTIVIFSLIAGVLKNKTSISEGFLRRFWNSLGMYGVSAALLALAYAPVTAFSAIVLLTISTCLTAACNLGYLLNSLDLSPNFAGVIFSIVNTTSNTAAILGPLISTYLIKDSSNVSEWRLVFVIAGVLSCFGNAVFIIWGSTKKQVWDEGKRRIVGIA